MNGVHGGDLVEQKGTTRKDPQSSTPLNPTSRGRSNLGICEGFPNVMSERNLSPLLWNHMLCERLNSPCSGCRE